MEQMTVGMLAKQVNVSVRTLQYYDKIGLLKPSAISKGGRRLYGPNDMTILHQIITLKNLGLSLDDIKCRLMPTSSNDDIKKMLYKQAELIKEQILKSNKVVESIEMIVSEIEEHNIIDWSKYSNMMKLIQENNESFWVTHYLENDVLENITHVHEQYSEDELPSDWLVKCMKRVKVLVDLGLTPESNEAQELAAEVWTIVNKYTQGQPEILQKLYEFFNEAKDWPNQYAQMQLETHDFLEASIEHFTRWNYGYNCTV